MAKQPPAGAEIIEEKSENEVGKKLRQVKKEGKFSEYLDILKKQEGQNPGALSGDKEVIEKISAKELKEMNDAGRMIGFKNGTALVLKLAFIDKKKKKESK